MKACFEIWCDKKMPLKFKGKFYCVVVRSTMLYWVESWPDKKSQIPKIKIAEMRMMQWMCGHTRCDKIKSEDIRTR